MWVIRQQFAVGQGCFAAGTIGLGADPNEGESRYRYVYDCGSTHRHALREAIEVYKEETPSIDALFVSHFDNDHVSGLDQLLAVIQVNTVYIPYFDDVVPILDLIEAEENGALSASLIGATIEPEVWFGSRGVRRVVRVLGNGRPPPEGPDIPEVWPEPPTKEGKPLHSKEHPNVPRMLRKAQTAEQCDLFSMEPGTSIAILSGNQPLDWLLVPYVQPVPNERRLAFKVALRKALGLKSRKRLTAPRLAQALRNARERDKIKDCYDEIIAGGARRMHNRLSMSLYSGPSGQTSGQHWELEIMGGHSTPRPFWWHQNDVVGWLGTGDATLKVKKVRTAWQGFFRTLESQVFTLLLPHHGSRLNFHPKLLDFPNLTLCVAAAGKPSPYKHPSSSVIDAIGARKKTFWHVSQRTGTGLVEFVRSK